MSQLESLNNLNLTYSKILNNLPLQFQPCLFKKFIGKTLLVISFINFYSKYQFDDERTIV